VRRDRPVFGSIIIYLIFGDGIMPFKLCGCCRKSWESRDDFITSPQICLLGYQAAFDKPENGLFLFNHLDKVCRTTLGINVSNFYDMYDGIRYPESKIGYDECSRKCLSIYDLERCDVPCSMAFIREIIQIIRKLKLESPAPIDIR
jgi:hypothetical protein